LEKIILSILFLVTFSLLISGCTEEPQNAPEEATDYGDIEICDNDVDDDGDGAVDEAPCAVIRPPTY